MPVDSVGAASALTTQAPTRAPKQTMDGEMFMSLLITQLTNQDPSSPMDTNEMIAQTTQLAMMEKLNEIGRSTEEGFSLQMRQAAANLLGHEASYTAETGETITGRVTAVSYAEEVPTVTIQGVSVPLNLVAGAVAGPTDD